jgi:hypothetical protein
MIPKKIITKPSFSTKPNIVKRDLASSREEIERRIIEKFEKEKLEKESKKEPEATEVKPKEKNHGNKQMKNNKRNNFVLPDRNELNSNTVSKPLAARTSPAGKSTRDESIKRVQERRQHIASRTKTDNSLPISSLFEHKTSDSVFIVGGGPSLSGFDFNILDGKDTIAVNRSVEYIKQPTYFITTDYTYLSKSEKSISEYSQNGTSTVFVVNMTGSVEKSKDGYIDRKYNLGYYKLPEFNHVIESKQLMDSTSGFGKTLKDFAHGGNSGFCAIQLAIILGYKKIYLLGFDLQVNHLTHFHGGYKQTNIRKMVDVFKETLVSAIKLNKSESQIISCNTQSMLNEHIPYVNINEVKIEKYEQVSRNTDLSNLLIVGYYTKNTPYEAEAQKLITSCNKLGLRHSIMGVDNLGSWQANTRFKAKFMLDMLINNPSMRLLYVDVDAVMHRMPNLFINYSADIAVRFQDFTYRKNECLSGTIYMENNLKTRKLCELWLNENVSEGPNAKTFEQWNLGKIIEKMAVSDGLVCKNLPPEYTFIFDSMRKIYPNAVPVIEHFQASRKYKKSV